MLLACVLPALAAPRFAQEGSDLRPDPAARYGTLANGVRYVIYPNHEPKGRASLRLAVMAGSFNENETQRGLAHYLEHMAFNGSQHYAPGTLVEFFQRMGMSSGGDTNAFTSFDRTVYMLELPDTKSATLTEGARVLSDDVGALLLLQQEIDKERGVILSEKRVRDSVGYRTQVAEMALLLGGTRIPERMPIGETAVIEHAPRERFVDFWNKWYRPDNIAVVAVGDFDPAAMEKVLNEQFSAVKARAPEEAAPARGTVARFEGLRAGYHPEAEAPATQVHIVCAAPYQPKPDTAAERSRRLPRELATAMLNRRFSILAKKPDAPFTAAQSGVGEAFKILREASVDLTCKPELWSASLAVGEQELRRALVHGFQPEELKEAVANVRNELTQAVKGAATRRSSAIAQELVSCLVDDEVFTSPADDLALFESAVARITPEDCAAALKEAFAANGRYVMVTGNVQISGDALAAITAAYTQSSQMAVAAPAASGSGAWAYTDFGAPGKVAKRECVADLDLTLVTFENGVRLNLKKTDFEAGVIHGQARVGQGPISEPPDQRGLAEFAAGTFMAGGLGRHSVDDLQRIFAGRNVAVRFQPANDAFQFSLGTTRDDLLSTLQLLAAEFTDPGYRPEAERLARQNFEQMYRGVDHTPEGPMVLAVANLLADGDPRFGLPPKEQFMARNLGEVRAWLTPQLMHGGVELALVGDLDVDAAIAAVARTLGALPPRAARATQPELLGVHFPVRPFAREFTIASEIPKGLVALYWPTTDGLQASRARRLNLLASIYQDRLRVRIREQLGATYSPNAASMASDVFPGYGYLETQLDVDPATAAKIAEAAIAVADDLAKKGVTAEELERARQPLLTAAKESLRSNRYWLGGVLGRAQERPEVLDWARTRLADLASISAVELSALARSYLGREQVSQATVLPQH